MANKRKAKRTAKQKAATKKLVALNKRKAKSKTVKRKTISQKPMATRRRRFTRTVRKASRSRAKFGGFLKRGIVGDTTSALGAGMLVGTVTDRIAPAATPFASLAAEFAAGGVTGMVAAEGLKSITGGQSILSGMIGSFGGGSQQEAGGL